ncbi:MAG: hypothetical protein HC880_07635 [Bacteroidia bacterium]|nr:hypothetical protein [Bacteroidia bacterium]
MRKRIYAVLGGIFFLMILGYGFREFDYLTSGMLLLLGGGILGIHIWLLEKSLLLPLERLKENAEQLALGHYELHFHERHNRDIRRVNQVFNQMAKKYLQATAFIHEIEKGSWEKDLDIDPTRHSLRDDVLIQAIVSLQKKLRQISNKEAEKQWVTEGLAQFGSLLNAGYENIRTLYDTIIAQLVRYLEANQGGIFVVNDHNADQLHLELAAAYAFNRKKFLKNKLCQEKAW